MVRFLRPLSRPVTYTRWLHLFVPTGFWAVWLFVFPEHPALPLLFLVPIGLVPAVRLAEGLQAQWLLLPHDGSVPPGSVSLASSATWGERWRTVLWLEVRALLSGAITITTVWGPALAIELGHAGAQGSWMGLPFLSAVTPEWWFALFAPLPAVGFFAGIVWLGRLGAAAALRLLGPSPAQRLAALEERTERLLERTRIARELHDSIGHALTVAVVQAGAARAAGDPEFTDRALGVIEETGRAALEDLERVLLVLRESGRPASQRPTLAEADRLLESARASGAVVEIKMSGPLERLPGPVSREGYRILQEALTNVLRHSGPVPVRILIEVTDDMLGIEVANPLAEDASASSPGNGLRGIRERAALLGGEARTGAYDGEWQVSARLPFSGAGAGAGAGKGAGAA
ncbi:sensor histidine kinase [Streptomyces sp. SID1121]|uniref:sensor histidine kinase n=1 Tax=Streptomyces sp. SID1121 TaxID=3425888 RepID=UPI004056234A